MFLLPLRPYVPVGTLRRAATYPDSLESHRLEAIAEAFERVGLGHLADKLEVVMQGGRKRSHGHIALLGCFVFLLHSLLCERLQ